MRSSIRYTTSLILGGLISLAGCTAQQGYKLLVPLVVGDGDRVVIGSFNRINADLANPAADIWLDLPEYTIQVIQAPPVHPSVNLRVEENPQASEAYFRVARDTERFYVWLKWRDDSVNQVNAFDQFSDGAAVQFALGDHKETTHMMGTPDWPVNIWYWKASGEPPQNLTAGGFGSATQLQPMGLKAQGKYLEHSGHWILVFSRPIENTYSGDPLNLKTGKEIALAFAIWQGDDNNRDGFKRTSTGWIIASPGLD